MSDPQPLFSQQIDVRPRGEEGDAVFTFRDAQGDSVSVDLSPAAQNQLVSLILARGRAQVVGSELKLPRPPIRAYGFRPFVLSEDLAGLEVQIHEALALHLAFDGATYQQLGKAVEVLAPAGPDQRETPTSV